MQTRLFLAALGLSALVACAAAQPGEPGAAEPGARIGQQQPSQEPRGFANADEFLTALERSGENLVTLTAGIKYDRTFELQGDRQIRIGTLYFVGGTPDTQNPARRLGRKFAIVFTQLWIGNERRESPRTYLFDGAWLVERLPEDKLQLRKQIVAPGEVFDPLRIGEGPLPIPIGQPKADILARYQVELREPADGIDPDAAADDVDRRLAMDMLIASAQTQQIRLVPRPERAEEDDFTEIRLWYMPDSAGNLLPQMARTVNRSGDVSVVQLINVQAQYAGAETNKRARVPEEVFDTTLPRGWREDVQDLRTPGNGPPAQPAGERPSAPGR
jgi:hypothetical protein